MSGKRGEIVLNSFAADFLSSPCFLHNIRISLISALASASGHNLVRINLSEQTDISDLMGNDLPCTSESDNDGSSHASFRWCDGVLLQAIKRGDWVLLDELNLASQSVLEGLNSCLDHRASVYIPELGKSFDCPPSFRIFAAQNPLAQGGGRKGLPKSFLNRFTKVHVEALTRDDLLNIVSDQFPSIPMKLVTNMVDINCGIQHDIVQSSLYGQQGSPWEFNLRDVFRWCQLLVAKGGDITPSAAAKYADILYTQRLRTPQDRRLVKKRIDEYLGADAIYRSPSRLSVSKTSVVIGTTSVVRNLDVSTWSDISTQDSEPSISQALSGPMEAVASCVNRNWPCLLVDSSSSGKNLLKVLSDACNIHIETLAMSSSTDVTELIGCFEQTDSMKIYKDVLVILRRIYNEACLSQDVDAAVLLSVVQNNSIIDQKASSCLESFTRNDSVLSAMNELLSCYESIASCCPAFKRLFSSQILYCRQWLSSTKKENDTKKTQSPFQWVDGTLVQAMERGYWLHLENVNYCPSSVLDRLNPLMEFGGELIVTECGITDSGQEAKPRVICPHPNFRLFLSMDPNSHGEVSRAMRNRCIEVCIMPPAFDDCGTSREFNSDQVKIIDALTGLFDCDIRSYDVAQYMVTTHRSDCKQSLMYHEDVPTMKSLKGWGNMFSSLLKRGTPSPIHLSRHLLYETYAFHHNDAVSISPTFSGLIRAVSSRQDLRLDSFNGDLAQFGRLVRVMTSCDQDYLRQISAMDSSGFDLVDSSQRMKLRFQSINRLLETIHVKDLQQLLSVFDGYCPALASQIKIIVLLFSLVFRHLPKIQESGRQVTLMDVLNEYLAENCRDDNVSHAKSKMNGICLAARLYYSLEEALTYCQLDHSDIIPSLEDMNVISISYCINEKRIEVSDIMCPVTPILFPLFQLVDALLHKAACAESVSAVMSCRDRLWQFLTRSNNIGLNSNSQVGTSFGGFLTNYTWLKKAICNFFNSSRNSSAVSYSEPFEILRQLQLVFDKIDSLIEESMGGSISSSDHLWKKGGHPLLPSSLDNLEVLSTVRGIASQCTLVNEDLFGFTRMVSSTVCPIDVNTLVRENHPCLYMSKDFALQLLGAISTIFWATTDEMKDEVLTRRNDTCNAVLSSITESFKRQSENFVTDLNFSTIDTAIKTVENSLDLEAIKGLGEESKPQQSGTDFAHNLVVRLGQIQKVQLGK